MCLMQSLKVGEVPEKTKIDYRYAKASPKKLSTVIYKV